MSKELPKDTWQTPDSVLTAVRTLFVGPIELDPASSRQANQRVRANRYFDIQMDGLPKPWKGKVFLNPPYSQPLCKKFVQKFIEEYKLKNMTEGVILLNACTDTLSFHKLLNTADALCLTRGRLQFYSATLKSSTNRYGQAIFYMGKNSLHFQDIFDNFGWTTCHMN